MASSPIPSQQTDGEKVETVTDFIFLSSKISEDDDCSQWTRKLWYIYIMEYYLTIKMNAFESIVVRWMKV